MPPFLVVFICIFGLIQLIPPPSVTIVSLCSSEHTNAGNSPSYRYEKVLTNRQAAHKAFPEIFAPTTLDGMSWTEDAVAQEKGHGGWMVDLSIGKSVRLKEGSLNFNLMITNLLNNQTIVTGGYEQNSRSSYTVDANGNVKNPRLYQFSKNPKKYYTWGTNGMFQVSYRF